MPHEYSLREARLKDQTEIVVLNAPKSFEPELARLKGVSVKRSLTGVRDIHFALTVYIMPGFAEYSELLAKLGKHKTGRSCLYVKSLDDVHIPTLKTLVRQSVKHMKRMAKERTKGS